MDNKSFVTSTHAKCIIAGEHAVLRGHPSLVFPVKCKSFELTYIPENHALDADVYAPYGDNLLVFLWRIMSISLQMLNKDISEVKGKFILKNAIPMGCGLGFSAAICAAISQWLVWQGWLNKKELFNFARTLEHGFHGKSSGVDIAGALSEEGIIYSIHDGASNIPINWKPYIYLSSSKHHCSTEKCVSQVEKLHNEDKSLADYLDYEMAISVTLAIQALAMEEKQGFAKLAMAINKANTCFEKWDLITPDLASHIDILREAGAAAVKPTGSGGGGYIISLWHEPPKDPELIKKLKPLF